MACHVRLQGEVVDTEAARTKAAAFCAGFVWWGHNVRKISGLDDQKNSSRPSQEVALRGLTFARWIKARVRLGVGLEPLSYLWGFYCGLPIHRYYLEEFLREYARDILGRCLEFQNPSYANRFGGTAVEKLDIVHIDDTNPQATIVADLTKPNAIPSRRV